jgi:hypothetical protein
VSEDDKTSVRQLLDRYCTAMSERDRATWLDCFAPDAVQEDPVGSAPNVGHEAIGKFFDDNAAIPIRIWCSDDPLVIGDEVLAFFSVEAEMDGAVMVLPRIIDHIVLTPDRTRFRSLRAFFDLTELRPKR